MKKSLRVVIASQMITFLFASSVYGVELGGFLGSAVRQASGHAVEKKINKDLAKKVEQCQFIEGSSKLTCDFNKIATSIADTRYIIQATDTVGENVYVYAEANCPKMQSSLCWERQRKLRDILNESGVKKISRWNIFAEYQALEEKDPEVNNLRVWVDVVR